MSDVVHLAKTFHGIGPVFVRQSTLEQNRGRTLDHSPVGTFDDTIRLVPIRGGLVVQDPKILASCVELRSPVRVPTFTLVGPEQLVDILYDVGF